MSVCLSVHAGDKRWSVLNIQRLDAMQWPCVRLSVRLSVHPGDECWSVLNVERLDAMQWPCVRLSVRLSVPETSAGVC